MPHKTHRSDIQVRFSDTDALGHINNASYATYAELARLDFLSTLGESVKRMILASLTIDFRRQVQVGEAIHVDSWVERLGTSSMAVSHVIYAAGERAADVKSVVVYFDYTTNKSMPLTDAMRTALAPYIRAEAT